MNVVQEIQRINEREARLGGTTASWHDEYKDSAYIYVGGLPFDLTEGDVICMFSQYGEIVNIHLVRDKETGKSKGYCFLQYEDQRSTILAVDNLNGAKVLERTLRVDHVKNYRQPKDSEQSADRILNAAPQAIKMRKKDRKDKDKEEDDEVLMERAGIDPEDPMARYYLKKYKQRMKREKRQRHRDKRSQSPQSPPASAQ